MRADLDAATSMSADAHEAQWRAGVNRQAQPQAGSHQLAASRAAAAKRKANTIYGAAEDAAQRRNAQRRNEAKRAKRAAAKAAGAAEAAAAADLGATPDRSDIVTRGAAGRVVGWRGGREGGRWGRQRGWRRLGSVRLPVAVIAAKVSELVLALPEFTSSDLLQCFRFLVHVLVEGQAPSLCIPDTLWAGVGGILKAVD